MDRKRRLMENNNGWPLRSQLFDGAPFRLPLLSTAVPASAATGTTATFTRATAKTWPNNDGYLVTGLAGEIGFVGARRIDNLIRLGAAQSSTLAVAASVTMTLPAGAYQFSMGAGTGTVTFSGTGGATGTLAASALGRTFVAKTISAGTLIVTASVATLTDIQVVSMVAETDQTTLREYVSVGVTSAPYYHGSMVDGVKCFPTDLAGNALPTSYTYDAVSLNGVAGTYVSTSDSVAASITGDIDIRVKVALNDYTPTVENVFVCKNDAANNMAYYWILNGAGTLSFITSTDGTAAVSATSTASTGITDGAVSWIRVTRDVDNGAGGNTTVFYKSSDGVTWTKIGADVVNVGTTSIYDSAAPLALGMDDRFNAYILNGKIYQAQIYNGINGTLAVDFDASRYAGGTTLTGSTGETWTLQGNAVIHPTNSPMLGYQAEGARTNLCLQSQTFDSWTDSGATVTANSTVAPDGTTTADTITRVAGQGDARYVTPTLASNAVHAVSLWIKKGTSPSSLIALYDVTAVTYRLWADVTWSGTTPVFAFTNGSLVRSVEWANGLWRVEFLTETVVAANTNRLYLYPGRAGSANGETVIAWGAQVELGSFASSSIATTTIAVARNADVLTYSSAGNILGTAGWAYAEYTFPRAADTSFSWRILNTGAASVPLYLIGGAAGALGMADGAARVGPLPTYPINTPTKAGSTWGGTTGIVCNAGTAVNVVFDGDMNIGSTIDIGHLSGTGGFELNGTIRNVRIGQRALSSSELQAVTS